MLPGRCSAGTTVIRVLVAEDDEFQRMAIASRFRAANDANVAQGSTVQFEALLVPSSVSLRAQVSADANFQLVLLDVCLGVGETSDALIGEIRRALGASVPIVMFSAVAHQDLVERCLSLGADAGSTASSSPSSPSGTPAFSSARRRATTSGSESTQRSAVAPVSSMIERPCGWLAVSRRRKATAVAPSISILYTASTVPAALAQCRR